ncbi:hypothetical protein [Saccharopolyspora phatthalungensis]|uniref:Uncharacterized protein n=1 Tax=Saccharopolyspora phatthalungensis TaxID=664693 RepID=A0A840Q7E0_9PSEU|nr:hypothetical protein [Saccharopolyspora phatthalungensis]MBB5156604.1 hypothetical protein [Saccharopolyspora phatthalungensis]
MGIAQVIPDGDVLPVRAQYGRDTAWNIGVNPLHAEKPLWYTIPDLIASTLLSGKPPRVVKAVRFVPAGKTLSTLNTVRLRGQVPVDPVDDDFFRTVVEQRQAVKDSDPTLAAFLKVLANAGSYGIFAQMDRQELATGQRTHVTVHGAAEQPWKAAVAAPEKPGEYVFPPIAACITGAARLMLAMLERSVTDAGGVWTFCDTDSMAIVANEHGTLIDCPGGPHTMPDGRAAVRALTLDHVDTIRQRFARLNPYRPDAVTDILKAEFTGWCYAISAKRYALYRLDPAGIPAIKSTSEDANGGDTGLIEIDKTSEHGLGHLLNPTDPDSADRDWIRHLWQLIISDAHRRATGEPDWLDRPALSRISISSPTQWRPFTSWNAGKPYRQQIKPFNFLLVGHVAAASHPPGTDPQRFHLIAPYDSDPATWLDLPWRNRYDPHGTTYRTTTERWNYDDHQYRDIRPAPDDLVQLKTYRQILHQYRRRPEHKANGPDGKPCHSSTTGLLQRRTVRLARLHHIGKETNQLDEWQTGGISPDHVLTDYDSPNDALTDLVLPALASHTTQQLADHIGLSAREIERIRAGDVSPRPAVSESLTRLAVDTAITELDQQHTEHPWKREPDHTRYAKWESVLAYRKHHHNPQRLCPCGCGQKLTRRQKYATDACRKRHNRAVAVRPVLARGRVR